MPKNITAQLLVVVTCCLFGLSLAPASASAEVDWNVHTRWGPTNLPPGGQGEFVVKVGNEGTTDSSGQITVVVHLPPGVISSDVDSGLASPGYWLCVGTSVVTCKTSQSVPGRFNLSYFQTAVLDSPPSFTAPIFIHTQVNAGVPASGTVSATVTGGGGAQATGAATVPFSDLPTPYGIVPGSWLADVFAGKSPIDTRVRQAGTHPFELRTDFDFNLNRGVDDGLDGDGGIGTFPVDRVRNVEVRLPRGLIGNPQALPTCDPLDFLKSGGDLLNTTGCPADSQIGYLVLDLGSGNPAGNGGVSDKVFTQITRVAVYNLRPPRGTPIDLGFRAGGYVIGHIYASLDPAHDYAIEAVSPYNSDFVAVRGLRLALWGVPGDAAHDQYRARQPVAYVDSGQNDIEIIMDGPVYGAPYPGQTSKPFFTLPMDCGVDNGPFAITADSWHNPGHFIEPLESDQSLNVNGCDDPRFRFDPDVSLQPTSRAAGGPTGLNVHLEVPQRDNTVNDPSLLYNESGNLHAIDTPPLKKAVVTLPEGMTLSTSAAQGLNGCTPAQIGLGNNDPVTCPDSSQYGELTLHTPLLPADEPMHGYIYIAQQGQNPFHNFLSMYFVIENPDRGLRVKIPGKIDLDPVTGQITTTFDDLPQFPVSDMELSLKGGVRAGLVNPTTCGSKTISAIFYSWVDPNTPITKTSSYDITQKADGSPCLSNLGDRPFKPELTAGTVSNSAGSFSPFLFRLTRTDDDQEFSQVGVTFPPGLVPKIAGLTECSNTGIAQAILRTGAGQGALEQADPSCPASSQLGTSDVGTGVGQVITYVPGKVYLAGPYQGAPLSIVAITPILAGPYDLGVIAVRSAAFVDPTTGQASVKSDPFPQIYQGIPVRIRDIRIGVNNMLNPTSCDPMSIEADVTGTGGDVNSSADDTQASASSRFQAADCRGLGFKPKLSFRLFGPSHRGAYPKLRAILLPRRGDANISRASVTLPPSEFLANNHLNNVCTRAQFASDSCPRGSIYGHAEAISPLLDQPLKGPVYLKSSDNLLPDLVASLRGPAHQPIRVDLTGRVDSIRGGIRNTFEIVPDAPVSKFILNFKGASHGLLQNSRDICKGKAPRATAKFTAHSGKRIVLHPPLRANCKHKRKKHKRAHSKDRRIQLHRLTRVR